MNRAKYFFCAIIVLLIALGLRWALKAPVSAPGFSFVGGGFVLVSYTNFSTEITQ
jgi:hypothetical protein